MYGLYKIIYDGAGYQYEELVSVSKSRKALFEKHGSINDGLMLVNAGDQIDILENHYLILKIDYIEGED